MNKLLEIRAARKSKKPSFARQDSWKRKLLGQSWRRTRGLHSKMRLKHKSNPKIPSQGYRSPKAIRGTDPMGKYVVVVHSVKQLDTLKEGTIMIAATVGIRKKLEIMKAAGTKFTVSNVNKNYVQKIESVIEKKKKAKNAKATAKIALEKKAEKKEEKKAEKKTVPEEKTPTEEEKQKTAKRETEKIITKRE